MSKSPAGWFRDVESVEESQRLRSEARGHMSSGSWSEATSLLRRAIDLDPMSINCELLGDCLLQLGQVKEALIYLAAGTGLGHNQFKTRVKLAKALYALGAAFEHDALWQLEEALRINPDYRVARELLEDWLRTNPSLKMHLGRELRERHHE